MKSLILLVAVVFSSTAFARQYMQCNSIDMNTTDVAVVNLTTVNGGTLFISSGMQNPEDERILFNIALSDVEEGKHIYGITNSEANGFVVIDSAIIGKSTNYTVVDLNLNGYQITYSCFARIYND